MYYLQADYVYDIHLKMLYYLTYIYLHELIYWGSLNYNHDFVVSVI